MYTDAKIHGEKVREKMLSFIVKYIEENQYPPTVKEIGHSVGLKSKSSVVSHLIRLREQGKIKYKDYQPRTITVPGYKFVKEMRKAIYFDNYVSKCPYFNGNTNLNNGYGCNHELQEEKENGQGKCFCWSCPCGYPADEESLHENDIEWEDGKPESDSMEEDSYIILN